MEPGIYHFYPQGLPLHRWNISNHDACGGQAAGLLLEGFRDFTLDGGGSRWVFHAQMLPCRVAHSSGVRLENFSLDLARPVYSEGVIREVRPQQMTVWIDPEKYPWNVENGRLVFTGENFRRAMHLWLEMDAKTRAPAWGTEDLYFCTETQKVGLHPAIKAAAGDLVQITLKGGEHFLRAAAPATGWYSGTIPALPLPFMPRIPRISAVRTSASTMPRAWAFWPSGAKTPH